jgi:hypothetical protein
MPMHSYVKTFTKAVPPFIHDAKVHVHINIPYEPDFDSQFVTADVTHLVWWPLALADVRTMSDGISSVPRSRSHRGCYVQCSKAC